MKTAQGKCSKAIPELPPPVLASGSGTINEGEDAIEQADQILGGDATKAKNVQKKEIHKADSAALAALRNKLNAVKKIAENANKNMGQPGSAKKLGAEVGKLVGNGSGTGSLMPGWGEGANSAENSASAEDAAKDVSSNDAGMGFEQANANGGSGRGGNHGTGAVGLGGQVGLVGYGNDAQGARGPSSADTDGELVDGYLHGKGLDLFHIVNKRYRKTAIPRVIDPTQSNWKE